MSRLCCFQCGKPEGRLYCIECTIKNGWTMDSIHPIIEDIEKFKVSREVLDEILTKIEDDHIEYLNREFDALEKLKAKLGMPNCTGECHDRLRRVKRLSFKSNPR